MVIIKIINIVLCAINYAYDKMQCIILYDNYTIIINNASR